MIVVIGNVSARAAGNEVQPAGLAADVAAAAASAGSTVQLVARIGDDPAGDALLLGLTRAGIRHVATLRDPAHLTSVIGDAAEAIDPIPDDDEADDVAGGDEPVAAPRSTLDPEDIGLALRYLADFRVIVVVHPDPGVLPEVVVAASWGSAHLVVVTAPGAPAPDGVPADALVLAAPDDGAAVAAVATLLGRYAAAIDAGEAPAGAFKALMAATPTS